MKEPYEKPRMQTETVDIGVMVAQSPVNQLQALYGTCPPCPA